MKSRTLAAAVLLTVFGLLFFGGCGSSEETENDKEAPPPPANTYKALAPDTSAHQAAPAQSTPAPQPTTQPAAQPATQPAQTPAQTAPAPSNGLTPSGAFSVQVGAFSMSDKADQIAATARTRFPDKTVYELKDPSTSLIKVLVGDFNAKDDARAFRDSIIQQYGDDYKGAWVFNVPSH